MTKALLVKDKNTNSYRLEYRTSETPDSLEVPVDPLTGEFENPEWLDIVDDIDEETQLVIGKKAVVNEVRKTAKLAELETKAAADAATQYQRDRRAAYPSIGDQLDAIYKKFALNDPTEYDAIAAEIAAVKQQFPKPE